MLCIPIDWLKLCSEVHCCRKCTTSYIATFVHAHKFTASTLPRHRNQHTHSNINEKHKFSWQNRFRKPIVYVCFNKKKQHQKTMKMFFSLFTRIKQNTAFFFSFIYSYIYIYVYKYIYLCNSFFFVSISCTAVQYVQLMAALDKILHFFIGLENFFGDSRYILSTN